MISIREFNEADITALWQLFYNTVHTINAIDYTREQLQAWAPSDFDRSIWANKMRAIKPFIALFEGQIVGYADLQNDGLIDHFFCHHNYIGKGVGKRLMTHILDAAKQRGLGSLYSEVSVTARPFYERFGFIVEKEQTLNVRGASLQNFLMKRLCSPV